MKPRRCLKTLVVAIGLVAPWVLLQAVSAPPVAAQDIQVSLANPSAAPQGTANLNVTIKGKGFKRGAVSRFLVTTDPSDTGGITVKSTTFVNTTELVANVDIADTATLSKFDIEVRNSDGRTGKGIELFTVTVKGTAVFEIPVTVEFRDDPTDGIQSDLLGAYSHGTDAVRAVLVANGNLALKTNDSNKPPIRKLFFDFTRPALSDSNPNPPFDTGTVPAFMATSDCDDPGGLRDMAAGAEQECRLGGFFLAGTNTQWFFRFGEYDRTTLALVHRVDGATWEIEVPAPAIAKLLSATTKGRLVLTDQGNFSMPVKLIVTRR
jgi:hypothetical protein